MTRQGQSLFIIVAGVVLLGSNRNFGRSTVVTASRATIQDAAGRQQRSVRSLSRTSPSQA